MIARAMAAWLARAMWPSCPWGSGSGVCPVTRPILVVIDVSKRLKGFAATLRRTARTPFALIATAPLDISSLESYKAEKSTG
jgi:hypothetical protein